MNRIASLKTYICILIFILFSGLLSCQSENHSMFELIPSEHTRIDFKNSLPERPGSNILETEFFYNGGGVAVGDINNDGLPDLYFTANIEKNALYLNEGNFQFKDITQAAGITNADGWSTGTTMADINGDGYLDIYICKAGKVEEEARRNKLFINNGNLTFTERAAEYNLDDTGYCTQANFFDYDRDGDLDLFIVNYSVKPLSGFDLNAIRNQIDTEAGDKLYRNDNGVFLDVSVKSGLEQNPIGFGLSATVSDVNKNGWPDIFVTNDFIEKDYLYMNQGDGTFSEQIQSRTQLTSYFSMGSDIADINNDGWADIFVLDMLPYDYTRRRVFKTPDYSMYDQLTPLYHRQNMRNTLQLNNGDGTFTEIGRLAGIASTDWSWTSLLADFDNDGFKDLFVTNGFPRFYTNLDYLNDVLWEQYPNESLPDDPDLLYELVEQMEKVELHNFAFQNLGDMNFKDVSREWEVDQNAVSGGSAYADLNNDGSLDLIVSNINEKPFIFKNNSQTLNNNNYLKIRLQGIGQNSYGIGAKVTVTGSNGERFYQEAFPVRGFQSSVDPVLLFGLNDLEKAEIEVIWPDQSTQRLQDIGVNQTITINQEQAINSQPQETDSDQSQMFLPLNDVALGLDYTHQGSFALDKINTILMPHTMSNLGPAMVSEDVNNDELADLFIGGGPGQPARLFLQQTNGRFSEVQVPAFEEHRGYEDIDALFLDVNGNGHIDLYVVSGEYSNPANGSVYQDRLYLNNGFGSFEYARNALPPITSSGSSVVAHDYDGDGDSDIFVGGRVHSNQYPTPPRSYLLRNDEGQFTDITERASPELLNPGMVNSVTWIDIDNNGQAELIITGEWMPVRIFKKAEDHTFTEITSESGLEQSAGWWNVLKVADLNEDGYIDLIAGNRGLNSLLKTSPEEPVMLFADDFNEDGFTDPVITHVTDGNRYPLPGRDRLLLQLPELEEQFPDYESYSTATIHDILTNRQIDDAYQVSVHTFESTVFKNNGDGTFEPIPLPRTAQIAPIYDMIVADFDQDRIPDILTAGNNYGIIPENGPTADEGVLLKGDGNFGFTPIGSKETGFSAVGEVREMMVLPSRIGPLILLARNNDTIIPYLYQRKE